MTRRPLICFAAALLLPAPLVMAHRLDAEPLKTDRGYRIEFFLGDGSPGSDLDVTAQREGQDAIEIGRTDAQGVVLFVPRASGKWTIVGKGGGHSTVRNPLVIEVAPEEVQSSAGIATPQAVTPGASTRPASPPTSSGSIAGAAKSGGRGRFPWIETAMSLTFIAVLTVGTLAMMRRSARFSGRPAEVDQLMHEVAHLQATITKLRREVAELKGEREHRS